MACEAQQTTRKSHRLRIHHALLTASLTLNQPSGPLEIISALDSLISNPHPQINSIIAPSKKVAKVFVRSQLGTFTRHDPTRAISFTESSLIPNEGIDAAALHLPTGTISPADLGDPAHHTVYEAELVGIRMAADLALTFQTRLQSSFWVFINNQPSIKALTQQLKPSPGLTLRKAVVESLVKLTNTSPLATATLVWCPAHVGIKEN